MRQVQLLFAAPMAGLFAAPAESAITLRGSFSMEHDGDGNPYCNFPPQEVRESLSGPYTFSQRCSGSFYIQISANNLTTSELGPRIRNTVNVANTESSSSPIINVALLAFAQFTIDQPMLVTIRPSWLSVLETGNSPRYNQTSYITFFRNITTDTSVFSDSKVFLLRDPGAFVIDDGLFHPTLVRRIEPGTYRVGSNIRTTVGRGFARVESSVGWSLSPVPEPTTWAMLIVGFGLVGAAARRRARVAASC